jgi:uncharacterized delta-60 repeat protein
MASLRSLAFAALGLVAATRAIGSPSTPDPAFGAGGKVLAHSGSGGAFAVALQKDGRIVTAGGPNGFRIARFLRDGTPDPDFGDKGQVEVDFGPQVSAQATGVVVKGGKIVAVGWAAPAGGSAEIALAQVLRDGSSDPDFGVQGKVTTPLAFPTFGSGLVAQADGKLLVAATQTNGLRDFVIARYEPDGDPDPSFGSGGITVTDVGADDFAEDLALTRNGGAVVVGGSQPGGFALARYDRFGHLDASFGTGGKVVTPVGDASSFATAVGVRKDGKLVVGGCSGGGARSFAFAFFQRDGRLESSRGTTGGRTTVAFPMSTEDTLTDLVVGASGKVTAAGYSQVGGQYDFAVTRLTAQGRPDRSFATEGRRTYDLSSGEDDLAHAIAIQKDRRIVVAGRGTNGSQFSTAIHRCLGR